MRKGAFYLLTLLLLAVAAEGAAQVGYRLAMGGWWSPGTLKRFATPVAAFEAHYRRRGLISDYVLHPYAGFARDGATSAVRDQLGFFTLDRSDPRKYGKADYVVVLTGGSVAIQVGLFGDLAAKLEKRLGPSLLAGRRLRLVTLALGSFKQPQQLMALNYLLVLGVKIDAIVNLDGYNDISAPTWENAAQSVHPIFPAEWARFLMRRTGGADLATVGEIAYLRRREQSMIWDGDRALYQFSAFVGFIRTFQMQKISARLTVLRKQIDVGKATTSESAGPSYAGGLAQRRADAAAYWRRASVLIHQLAQSNGIPYLHVLQPNQYVSGSKPLSDREKALYVRLGGPRGFGQNVRDGYPALLAAVPQLVAAGVDFVDATRLFISETRTVYRDACCHFNSLGTETLAGFVADKLAERLKKAADRAPRKPRQTP